MLQFKKSLITAAVLVISGVIPALAVAQTPGPVLFYSDLTDGPRTGGENNNGAYVCVYGRNFGSARGASTITIGGVAVTNYPVWGDSNAPARGDSKACFQLGNSVPTGSQSIQMTTSAGTSNTVPFYVRPDASDAIYCVSDIALPSGSKTPSDSNSGHFGACWATMEGARYGIYTLASPIVYFHNITATYSASCAPFVWCEYSVFKGTKNANIGLIVYPGSQATVGTLTYSAQTNGFKLAHSYDNTISNDYTVIAGFTIRAAGAVVQFVGSAVYPVLGLRLIGNDGECSAGDGNACMLTSYEYGNEYLGNYWHDQMLLKPHGYMASALANAPGGSPYDSADAVLTSVVSNGSSCTVNTQNDPGQVYVGETDIMFVNSPTGLPQSGGSPAVTAVTHSSPGSWVVPCTVSAGTYNSSSYPNMWYTSRTKYQHMEYHTSNATNWEVAWNEYANNWSNNDIDQNSTPLNDTNPRNANAQGWFGVPQPLLPTDLPQAGYGTLGTTTGCVSGGCTSARTLYVKMSWQGNGGETDASHETPISLSANQLLTMVSPPYCLFGTNAQCDAGTGGAQYTPSQLATSSCGAQGITNSTCRPTGWCIYVGTTSGGETQQSCLSVGTNWTEPSTSITSSGTAPLDWTTQTAAYTSGYNGTHILIHDNLIHGASGPGISMSGGDPTPTNLYGDAATGGGIYIYNNLVYREGQAFFQSSPFVGPYNYNNNLGSGFCMLLGSIDQGGPTGAGAFRVENNTCYDVNLNWPNGVSNVGMIGFGTLSNTPCKASLLANDNIFLDTVALSVTPWIDAPSYNSSPCINSLSGQKNIWYNTTAATAPPPDATAVNGNSSCVRGGANVGTSCFTNNVTADPLFVNASSNNFQLQSSSPAKSGGVTTYPTRDFLGVMRSLVPVPYRPILATLTGMGLSINRTSTPRWRRCSERHPALTPHLRLQAFAMSSMCEWS